MATTQTLIVNARLFTSTTDQPEEGTRCILLDKGTIAGIYESEIDLGDTVAAGCRIHDVASRLVCPAFVDGHMHILQFGTALQAINLDACKTLDDIRKTIRSGAAARPHAARLLVQGWMHFMTDSKALAADLDDLDSRPIYIYAKDLHSAWCNTAALHEMGAADMPDPPGGEILRDEHGKPSGLMSEAAAINIVWPFVARVTQKEEKLSQIRDAIRAYNEAGYTGVVEMATDPELWDLLHELHTHEGPLNIRLAIHWLIKPSKTTEENVAQVDRAIELHQKYNLATSPGFRITGIKIIGDGVVDACTASLSEPYSSPVTNCEPIWSTEQLIPVVQRADEAGLQCALHAIGDNTVRHAVNALSSLTGGGRSDKRHRIEHLELTLPEDSKRLGQIGITASVQPVHADPAIFRAWPTLIGEDRCKRAFAYGEFAENGACLAIGTDSPTAPHWPMRNLYTAATRRSAREEELTDMVNENFKLGLGQAVRAATQGAAYSCFADEFCGTIEVGKSADLVVLNLDWDANALLKGSVNETWFQGERIYQQKT